jgi:hypothetical protein
MKQGLDGGQHQAVLLRMSFKMLAADAKLGVGCQIMRRRGRLAALKKQKAKDARCQTRAMWISTLEVSAVSVSRKATGQVSREVKVPFQQVPTIMYLLREPKNK